MAAAALAFSQAGTSEISGTLKDKDGAALPNAKLTILHKDGLPPREIRSDSDGSFVAAALPAGEYSVRVEIANFKTQVREGLILRVGRVENVDLVLEVGDAKEVVIVVEAASLLQASNAESGEVISNQRIVSLPLNGRQFVDLTLLSDNVFKSPRGTRGSALAQTGTGVLVAGQRAGHNMYFLDGVSVTDQYFNHLVAAPPLDSIREFNIQKSIYAPEFGGKASATISGLIQSGGNAFHGTIYEFLRNDVFDSRNFFDPRVKPPFRQNQFGGTLGGPVRRNRTFFFTTYEGLRVRQALTQTFSVPTAAVRAGDFAGLPAIYDPRSTQPPGSRAPFASNRIPMADLDPIAAAFLQKVPLPNLLGQAQNYLATPSLENQADQGIVRVDHSLRARDQLFGRYYAADFATFQPFGSSLLNETLLPGFGYSLTTRTRNLALGETHVFAANLVSEVRFGFLRVAGGQQSQNQGVDFARQNGIGGVSPAAGQEGFPSVSFSGAYTTAGDPANLFTRRDNSFDYIGNLSWVRGSHSLKFGAYIFRLQFNPSESPNARGSFTFTPRFTSSAAGLADGNALADFLMGYPSSAQAGIGAGGSEYGRSTWTHFYAQDDWRIVPSVTLNYGVRYEVNGKITDTQNRLSSIETDRFVIASGDDGGISPQASALLGSIPVPYVTSKAAGYHRSLQLPNYHHIAPRVGLAWQISRHTAIRAGWGLFFNQAAYNIQTALTENLPFYFNKSVNTAATTAVPTLTTSNILLSAANGTIGGSTLDYPYRSEFANSWSFDVQRTFRANWLVRAAYFGSHVSGADNSTYRNVPLPGSGAIDPRRPNPLMSAYKAIRWDGWSIYHSGTLKLEKRWSSGLVLHASYTWSKALDDASDVGTTFQETNIPQDVRNVRAEKALSSFDHRRRVVVSFSYALPFRKGSRLLGGWSVSGLGSAQSGAPFTVNLPSDNANIGAGPSQRPDLTGDPNQGAPRTAQQWLNMAAFRMPAPFTFGNAARNVVFGDNEFVTDVSLHKETPIGERARIEVRAEVFNVSNHTNFADAPGRIAFTPTFGRYTSAGNSRQVQFGLKLVY